MTSTRALFGVLAVLFSQAASGHAVLLTSDPGSKAELEASPSEIRLGFNENVGPIFLKVLDSEGTEVGEPGEFSVSGNDVFLPLNAELANGTYVVVYRVISADTHPVGGSVMFAVGEPLAELDDISDAGAVSGWQLPVAANRLALYVGGTLAAGSALLLLLLTWPAGIADRLQRQGFIAAVITAVALPFGIGVGGAEMLAAGPAALFSGNTWMTGFSSTLGPSALIGFPGALLLAFHFRRRSLHPAALVTGAALVLGSFLVTGHAATAPPAWFMALVVGIHLIGAATWLGALVPLRVAVTREEPTVATRLLSDFSARGVWAVVALLISGLVISWVQLQSIAALVDTAYGIRLLAKIIVAAIIVMLALYNKHRLTDLLARRPETGRAALRRTIRAEYWLMMIVMALAVSLTLPSPPRAMVAANAQVAGASDGIVLEASDGPLGARLEVTPARTGENMLMLSMTDANGQPFELQRVRVFLSLPTASLEGIEQEAERMAPGMYHLMVNDMIIPGDWEVRIDAYIDDFDKRILRVTAPIR